MPHACTDEAPRSPKATYGRRVEIAQIVLVFDGEQVGDRPLTLAIEKEPALAISNRRSVSFEAKPCNLCANLEQKLVAMMNTV